MRPLTGLVVAVAFLGGIFATGVAVPTPASAHAELASSNPARGATLDALPGTLELTFTEVVGTPAAVKLTGPGGVSVADGDPEVVDRTLTQPTNAGDTPAGTYVLSYRVTSADGHPISGTVSFAVGKEGTAAVGGDKPAADGGGRTGLVAGLVALLLLALGLVVLSLRRLVRPVPGA